MPERHSFDYAIIRIVPRVERGESINAGIILCCLTARYLGACTALDRRRLLAVAPDVDLEEVERQLAQIEAVARGDRQAGEIAGLPLQQRWHWLVTPRSTIIQPSPAHSGLAADPVEALQDLCERLVRTPPAEHLDRR